MNTTQQKFRTFFLIAVCLSSALLTACGDDGTAHLKPKSQNIGAEPGTDKISKAGKSNQNNNTNKTDNTEKINKGDNFSKTLVPDNKNSSDIADKNDNGDNAGKGRELSADAGSDDSPSVPETKIDNKVQSKNTKSVVIPENKPTVSTMESLKEMGESVASLLKKKPINFTQCFQSFAEGDYSRKIEFFSDNERKCWGQAWAIPKSYVYNIREEPNDDILILKFDVKTMKSDEDTKSLINNTTLVVISPSAGFSPKRTIMKRKISSVASVFENQRQMFGMDLYEPSRWQNEFRSVFFFDENNKDFYARCLLSATEKIDDAPEDLKCDVYTHVDNRVDIDYKINFSDMEKMEDINKNVQSFLRGMMRKNNKT